MSPVPVYSARFVFAHNVTGPTPYVNESGSLIIIRNVTTYFGGNTADQWSLEDEIFGVMLATTAPGVVSSGQTWSKVWEELHLCWDPGKEWHVTSGAGWDYSFHGYQLSLP